jgi:predicted Rdx family selenoprotein
MKRLFFVTLISMLLLAASLSGLILAQDDDTYTTTFDLPANQIGWLQTTIWLDEGDEFTLSATGLINIWPNCEETKVSAGYPDLDCREVQEISPEGTDVFGPGGEEHPLPGAPVAALLIRIGETDAFAIGEEDTFTAETSGLVYVGINDSQYQEDNQGNFTITITTPDPVVLPPVSGSWRNTGVVLEPGQTYTVTVTGTVNIWPNCQETRAEQGFPNADCAALQALGPDGTDYFGAAEDGYPLPGENIAALVGRISGGPVFLIGAGGTFTTETGGTLVVAVNDTAYWRQDDSGTFDLVVVLRDSAGDDVTLTPTPSPTP